jgi:hypothetical protein
MEWASVYHIKGWGKFNRNDGDLCTGADKECGWKGVDRGGLAEWGQFGKRRNK